MTRCDRSHVGDDFVLFITVILLVISIHPRTSFDMGVTDALDRGRMSTANSADHRYAKPVWVMDTGTLSHRYGYTSGYLQYLYRSFLNLF